MIEMWNKAEHTRESDKRNHSNRHLVMQLDRLGFKSEILLIHLKKLPSKAFSVVFSIVWPQSVFSCDRSRKRLLQAAWWQSWQDDNKREVTVNVAAAKDISIQNLMAFFAAQHWGLFPVEKKCFSFGSNWLWQEVRWTQRHSAARQGR